MQSIVFACDILPNNKIWLLLTNQRSLTKQINNKIIHIILAHFKPYLNLRTINISVTMKAIEN